MTFDLLVSYDEQYVENLVLDGVGQLVGKLLSAPQRAMKKLRLVFKALKPEITLSDEGFKVRSSRDRSSVQTITQALLGLDAIAKKEKTRAILVFDEFQQIASIQKGQHIEACIRHAVERAKHVSYIFSGSNRHMLSRIFEDSSRPLYHLCERFTVDRIGATAYQSFISHAAKQTWGKSVTRPTIATILDLTERHPYYVNRLCALLWKEKKVPTKSVVEKKWDLFVQQEKHRIGMEIQHISPNQRAVLSTLAANPTSQPRSKAFLRQVRLANASAGQAIQVLLEKDLIYENPEGSFCVLDPAIRWYLTQHR